MNETFEENNERLSDQEYEVRANVRNSHRTCWEKITFRAKKTVMDIAHEHALAMDAIINEALVKAGNPHPPFQEKLSDEQRQTIQETITQHNTATFPEKTREEAVFEEELQYAYSKKAYAKVFDLIYQNPTAAKKHKSTYPLNATFQALSQDKAFQKKCLELAIKYTQMNVAILLIFFDLFSELGILNKNQIIQNQVFLNNIIDLLKKSIKISPHTTKKIIEYMELLEIDLIINPKLIIHLKTPHILLAAIDYSVEYYQKIKEQYFTSELFDEEVFLEIAQEKLVQRLQSMMKTHPFLYTKVRFQWIKHGLLSSDSLEELDQDYKNYRQTDIYKQQVEDCRRDKDLITKLSRKHIGSEEMRYELEDETMDPIEWKMNDNQTKRNIFLQKEKSYLRRFLEKYPELEDILKKHIFI